MKNTENTENQSAENSTGITLEINFNATENTVENQTAYLIELAQTINQVIQLFGEELDHRGIRNLAALNVAILRKVSLNYSLSADQLALLQKSE